MTDDKRNPLGDAFAGAEAQEQLAKLAKNITAEDLAQALRALETQTAAVLNMESSDGRP